MSEWNWPFERDSERGVRVRYARWLRILRDNHPELELRWKFDYGSDVIVSNEQDWERKSLFSNPGFPDVILWAKDSLGVQHKIAIEMKRSDFYGKADHLSSQSDWADYLSQFGFETYFAAGFDAITSLTLKLLHLRGKQ